jgi:hypothetical protein
MQIDIEKKLWVYVGRVPWRKARLGIVVGFGYREDAQPGEIVWRHYWQWSSDRLPHFLWANGKIIGYSAFGRCRVWDWHW